MRPYLFFVLCIAGLFPIQAQPNVGLYAGLNNVSLSGDTPNQAKYKGKQGGTFGANIDFRLTEEVLLSFQPGYKSSNMGLQYLDDATNTYKDSIDLNIQSAVLPILVNVITDNKKWYFTSGVEIAALISSTATIIDSGEEINLDADTNDFNLSINFGVTYLIHFGKPFMTIGARYSQGLLNLTNAESSDSYVPRIKTSGLHLQIGFQYPLNKKDE